MAGYAIYTAHLVIDFVNASPLIMLNIRTGETDQHVRGVGKTRCPSSVIDARKETSRKASTKVCG